MDSTSGLSMAVIGITTVFLALTMLVAVVTVLARLINRPAPEAAAADTTATPAAAAAAPAGPDPRLRAVAVAAFALHHHVTRRRRFAALATAAPGTPWRQAGRAEQASTLPGRG